MSKGSKIVPVRVPPLFLAAIDAAIVEANKNRKGEPYTRSSWILSACSSKLDHNSRGKKKPVRSNVQVAVDAVKSVLEVAAQAGVTVAAVKSALE